MMRLLFTITLTSDITKRLDRQCYCTLHLFPPVLCDDAIEILGPCRPAFHTPRMLVTVLVAQHRGLAGRVGARGMPGVVAAGYQVAFQGGLEGRGGVALRQVVVELANHFEHVEGQVVELQWHS